MQSHAPTPSPGYPFAFRGLAPPIIPSALTPRARPRADSSLVCRGKTRDARCLALTVTSRYPADIPLISASPYLSGPRRAATLTRRAVVRGVSLGTIMPGDGRKGKEETERCRLSVVGCQLTPSQGKVDSRFRRNDRVGIGVHLRSSAVPLSLCPCVSARNMEESAGTAQPATTGPRNLKQIQNLKVCGRVSNPPLRVAAFHRRSSAFIGGCVLSVYSVTSVAKRTSTRGLRTHATTAPARCRRDTRPRRPGHDTRNRGSGGDSLAAACSPKYNGQNQ